MPGDPWFRARGPEEGQGYSVANAKGLVAGVLFGLFAGLSIAGPVLVWGAGPTAFGVGAAALAATISVFILVLKAKSDWRG